MSVAAMLAFIVVAVLYGLIAIAHPAVITIASILAVAYMLGLIFEDAGV